MNETTIKYFEQIHMEREREYVEACIVHECESPIEELFALAFYSNEIGPHIETMLDFNNKTNMCKVNITAQQKIGKYRVDFLIRIHEGEKVISEYAIELDGHDFHEKTKEQVKRRNERDRILASKGITVFHFSGSEVYNDPDECVIEVGLNIVKIEEGKK